ncbi:hypothetical protein BX616_006480, partial [Lobosporangium transversale]
GKVNKRQTGVTTRSRSQRQVALNSARPSSSRTNHSKTKGISKKSTSQGDRNLPQENRDSTSEPSSEVEGASSEVDSEAEGAPGSSSRKEVVPIKTKGSKSSSSIPTSKPLLASTKLTRRTAAITTSAPASSGSTTTKEKEQGKGKEPAQISSDEESTSSSSDDDANDGGAKENESEEGAGHQLRLRPTLRIVSKATVTKTWKPINIKTRTHVQSMIASLFPAAISQARGEKRKIATQTALNRLMQKMNDRLSELNVPPPRKDRPNYPQLAAQNRQLEAMLVSDLEQIRDLELRLEQEQILEKREEQELENFQEQKRMLDSHNADLQRHKLHFLLHEGSHRGISKETLATLSSSTEDRVYNHLSAADQRLMALMPLARDEDFSEAELRDQTYN